MHTTLVRNIAIVIFIGLLVMCVVQFKSYQGLSDVEQADGIITLILCFIVTAVFGGLMFVFYVLPSFGDAVGEAMLSSAEEAGTDPYLKARGKIAIGDYEGAVAEFRQIARENPEDRLPITEIVKLYLERLHDPANAELVLENAIRDEHWSPEDASWFIFKLVDLVQTHQSEDQDRVVNLLQKVMRRYPQTRHSANATHRLREIDPQLVASVQAEIAAEKAAEEAAEAEAAEAGEAEADFSEPAAETEDAVAEVAAEEDAGAPAPEISPAPAPTPTPASPEPPKPSV